MKGLTKKESLVLRNSISSSSRFKVGEFMVNGRVQYVPLDWFRLSGFLYDGLDLMVQLDQNQSFFQMMDTAQFNWLQQKLRELENGNRKGAFWDNIKKAYKFNDIDMINPCEIIRNSSQNMGEMIVEIDMINPCEIIRNSSQNMGEMIVDLDDRRNRRKFLRELKNIARGEDVNDDWSNRDLDRMLDGLGDYDRNYEDTGNPLKLGRVDESKSANKANKNKNKGNNMLNDAKNTVVREIKELVNQSGAADIALGRLLYNNIKSAVGRSVVKISVLDKAIATVSKRMKYKNEVTELVGVLTLMVVLKQFYDHKALENVRGYIVNRLYTIGIESTGFDDVIALINQADGQAIND